MFEPVVDYVTNGTRVAIASLGGLGTAGIKFSKSFGGHVTALSRSEEKRSKAIAAGADEFYACLGNSDAMAELAGKFDVIIDTSPANADVGDFLTMLKFNGTYVRVGIPLASDMDFKFSYIPLIVSCSFPMLVYILSQLITYIHFSILSVHTKEDCWKHCYWNTSYEAYATDDH